MSDSSHLGSTKPTPRFISYKEARRELGTLADAYRELATIMLEDDSVSSHQRARLLSLRAVLDGRSDGESDGA